MKALMLKITIVLTLFLGTFSLESLNNFSLSVDKAYGDEGEGKGSGISEVIEWQNPSDPEITVVVTVDAQEGDKPMSDMVVGAEVDDEVDPLAPPLPAVEGKKMGDVIREALLEIGPDIRLRRGISAFDSEIGSFDRLIDNAKRAQRYEEVARLLKQKSAYIESKKEEIIKNLEERYEVSVSELGMEGLERLLTHLSENFESRVEKREIETLRQIVDFLTDVENKEAFCQMALESNETASREEEARRAQETRRAEEATRERVRTTQREKEDAYLKALEDQSERNLEASIWHDIFTDDDKLHFLFKAGEFLDIDSVEHGKEIRRSLPGWTRAAVDRYMKTVLERTNDRLATDDARDPEFERSFYTPAAQMQSLEEKIKGLKRSIKRQSRALETAAAGSQQERLLQRELNRDVLRLKTAQYAKNYLQNHLDLIRAEVERQAAAQAAAAERAQLERGLTNLSDDERLIVEMFMMNGGGGMRFPTSGPQNHLSLSAGSNPQGGIDFGLGYGGQDRGFNFNGGWAPRPDYGFGDIFNGMGGQYQPFFGDPRSMHTGGGYFDQRSPYPGDFLGL